MAPALANELNPYFKTEPNWDSIFKLKLTGDDDLPINKRGSGVRRLILLNLFRAEAERRQAEAKSPGVIYAIEEPETSQHPANQRMLVSALEELSEQNGCQVFVTTHVPELAGTLPLPSLRYVESVGADGDRVKHGSEEIFARIAEDLGVLPSKEIDDRVKVLVCVEGPHDVTFLKAISGILNATDEQILNLGIENRVAILPLGGGTLKQWVDEHYLKGLGIPEVHIYDRDDANPPKYRAACDQVNARGDNSWATLTNKREMENYLHAQVINEHFQINVAIEDMTDVPTLVAETVSQVQGHPLGSLGAGRAKKILNNEVVSKMTPELLEQVDIDREIAGWLNVINQRIN
jgi:predicted ATP-dependent endonuclease of OLD family